MQNALFHFSEANLLDDGDECVRACANVCQFAAKRPTGCHTANA